MLTTIIGSKYGLLCPPLPPWKSTGRVFAHKLHWRFLSQHKTSACMHWNHLGKEAIASVLFTDNLCPFQAAAYPLKDPISSADCIHLQILKYFHTQMEMLSLSTLKDTKRQNRNGKWETKSTMAAFSIPRAEYILHTYPSIPKHTAISSPFVPGKGRRKIEHGSTLIWWEHESSA